MKKLVLFVSILIASNAMAQEIFNAIGHGNLEDVKSIIESDSKQLNATLNDSYTTLSFSAMLGNEEIVRFLISKGAMTKKLDKNIKSALFYAIHRGHINIVKLLVEKGAPLNETTFGMSLLHTAVLKNNSEIVDYLLELGFDINERDTYGLTPLHIASELGFMVMCEKLIENGADLNIRANERGTPLDLSKEAGQDEISKLLIAKGATEISRDFPVKKGIYLGAEYQGNKLELFTPNKVMRIIGPHSGIAIAPDGKEVFWVRGDYSGKIWTMKEVDGKWTIPRRAAFSGNYDNSYPCFSPDGKKLFFTSDRPLVEDGKRKEGVGDIWFVEKTSVGWSDAINAGSGVNSAGDEFIASVDQNNTLYFTKVFFKNGNVCSDIFCSNFVDGEYQKAVALDTTINTSKFEVGPLISPDGTYLIFGSQRFGGEMETCLSFRKKDDSWTETKNIQRFFAPFTNSYVQGISADGKYILFAGKKNKCWDIYWVEAKIIEELKPRNLK